MNTLPRRRIVIIVCIVALFPVGVDAGPRAPSRLSLDEVRTRVRRHHVFSGLATWYGEEVHLGRACKSGQIYDAHAAKGAVDISEWEHLAGATLFVVAADGWVRIEVNDTGYLYGAGRFVQEERDGVLRWWPTEDEASRQTRDEGLDTYQIVIDLTPAMVDRLTGGSRDTTLVDVYLWR